MRLWLPSSSCHTYSVCLASSSTSMMQDGARQTPLVTLHECSKAVCCAPPAGSAGVWGGAAQKDDLIPAQIAAIAFSAACRQVYEGVALQHMA